MGSGTHSPKILGFQQTMEPMLMEPLNVLAMLVLPSLLLKHIKREAFVDFQINLDP